ncbi:MAG: hypothetical protein WC718_03340 [Phycisphaerales bacterium]|jgi:hypothetical protein
MRGILIACAGLSASLGSVAHAAFISFASDNDHTSYTFRGNNGLLGSAADSLDPQVLLVDDNNGLLPALAFNTNFMATFQMNYIGSTALPLPGKYVHSYNISGSFSFVDANTGAALLSATVQGGVVTAVGSGTNPLAPSTWDDTATMQFSDRYGVVTYTWLGADLPAYGLRTGFSSTGDDDGSFTLTSLARIDAGFGTTLNPQTGLPNAEWHSEGSFSGRTNIVPAPGALALCGLAASMVGRRKR